MVTNCWGYKDSFEEVHSLRARQSYEIIIRKYRVIVIYQKRYKQRVTPKDPQPLEENAGGIREGLLKGIMRGTWKLDKSTRGIQATGQHVHRFML